MLLHSHIDKSQTILLIAKKKWYEKSGLNSKASPTSFLTTKPADAGLEDALGNPLLFFLLVVCFLFLFKDCFAEVAVAEEVDDEC